MPIFEDISGLRFGRLTAMRPEGRKWVFLCDCGTSKLIWPANVRRGHTRSCGCLAKEVTSARSKINKTTHGLSSSAEYRAWTGAIQRCNNPKNKNYSGYGGRGIRVCDRWLKFENFIADIGKRPSKRHSLDRINVNGDYSPDNCRWATAQQQNGNKRSNILITAFGKTGCLAEFLAPYSWSYSRAQSRIARGGNPEAVLADMIGTSC